MVKERWWKKDGGMTKEEDTKLDNARNVRIVCKRKNQINIVA